MRRARCAAQARVMVAGAASPSRVVPTAALPSPARRRASSPGGPGAAGTVTCNGDAGYASSPERSAATSTRGSPPNRSASHAAVSAEIASASTRTTRSPSPAGSRSSESTAAATTGAASPSAATVTTCIGTACTRPDARGRKSSCATRFASFTRRWSGAPVVSSRPSLRVPGRQTIASRTGISSPPAVYTR